MGAVQAGMGRRGRQAAGLGARLPCAQRSGRGRADLVRSVRDERGRLPPLALGGRHRGERARRRVVAVRRERPRVRRLRGDRYGRPMTPLDPEEVEAAGAPARAELPPATQMGPVHLTVADLDRSLEYYLSAVGLRVLDRAAGRAVLGAGSRELRALVAER